MIKCGQFLLKTAKVALASISHLSFSKSTFSRVASSQVLEQSIFQIMDQHRYKIWIKEFDTIKDQEIEVIRSMIKALPIKPKISVIPLSIESITVSAADAFTRNLKSQIYQNWDLFSLDGGLIEPISPRAAVISANSVIRAADASDFVLPLPLHVALSPYALAYFVFAVAQIPEAKLLYADEDISRNGERSGPYFKTDWDPFFALGNNFPGLPTLYRSDALKSASLQDLESSTVDNLLHAIALKVSNIVHDSEILHIPKVLSHRNQQSDWRAAEARRILSPQIANNSDPAILEPLAEPFSNQGNRVRFSVRSPQPSVSIIIPTRDRAELIGPCLDGLLNNTDYSSMEIIVIDNGTTEINALAVLAEAKADTRVRILRDDRQFNYSALNNLAAKIAKGEILVLLNNDIEVIHAGWLKELVSLASRPRIGIVGAKLLYPDGRVQHAGVSFGPDKVTLHQMRLANGQEAGPHNELVLLRSVSAVTGACMALRRQLYLDVGGLNETFKVTFNDIDLCRRIGKKGLAIVWTPFAKLIHYESISRGLANTPASADLESSELMALWAAHPEFYETTDPFHNPQIEFKNESVDFAQPPRPHFFRPQFKEVRFHPFLY